MAIGGFIQRDFEDHTQNAVVNIKVRPDIFLKHPGKKNLGISNLDPELVRSVESMEITS